MARERLEQNRPERVPIAQSRNILTVNGKDPGFHYRWVKEIGGRIEMFKRAGYELVTHNVDVGDARVGEPNQLGSPVVALGNKSGEKLYLMRIKKEWYIEDQAAKQADIDALEEAMYAETDGRYGRLEIKRA